MEERDGYFTKLKHTIEAHYITSGEKVVMISHSMGGTVAYYFLQWVAADFKNGGGGGGKGWIEKYIHSFINIAGKSAFVLIIMSIRVLKMQSW